MDTLGTDVPEPPPGASFGELLRHYRLAAGLSQEALAERAGLSVQGLRALESGRRQAPYRSTVALLTRALALSPAVAATLEAAVARARPGSSGAATEVVSPPLLLPGRWLPPSGPTQPPLVGRPRELALLDAHLAGAGPPLLLLAGEPGIGKSRLLQHTAQQALAVGWQVVAGGCQRRGGQEPYAPLPEALMAALRAQTSAQLRVALRGCAWLVRLLPELAEAPIEPLPDWRVSPEQERRLLFAAVGRLLANVAAPAGVLLVLDDLQWAGADALDLLATLVRGGGAPLRIVGAYRDTEVRAADPLAVALADLAHAGLVHRQLLPPLAPAAVRQLLDALLVGGSDDRAALAARIAQRTGGVPFFVISCAQEQDPTTAAGTESMPWSVAQGILQRVAALPALAQEVLGAAAVAVERTVQAPVLATVLEQPERAVLVALEAAWRARLLDDTDGGYCIAHDLIREALEVDLGSARRAMLHRKTAEALERLHRERLPDYYEQLTYHYEQAGMTEKAIDYQLKAGEKALGAASIQEAQTSFQRALAQLEGSPLGEARREWMQTALRRLGLVMRQRGNLADAERHLRRAITLGGDLQQPARARVLDYFQLGDVLLHQGRYAELVQSSEEGLALLGEDTESTEAALMNHNLGGGHLGQGHSHEGWACYHRNARLIKTLGYSPHFTAITISSVLSLLQYKDIDEAHEVAQHIDAVAQQHGKDVLLAGTAQWVRAWILNATGDFPGAVAHLQSALEHFTRGDALSERITWSLLAEYYLLLGDLGRAAEFARSAHTSPLREGVTGGMATNARQLGTIALCEGSLNSAIRHLEAAVQPAGATQAEAAVSLGRAYLAVGRTTEAVGQFEEALATGVPLEAREGPISPAVKVLPNALSGIDEASGGCERVRALVEQLRTKHSAVSLLPFLACLEPAPVGPCLPPHVHEAFTPPLGAGWTWHDPFGDCACVLEEGLHIKAANGRTLWHVNLSAPRLLRTAPYGDWVTQTVCRPLCEGQPAIGGLLLWQDREHYLALERGHWGAADIVFRGCLDNEDRLLGRGRLPAEPLWLRLERQGDQVRALCSADGREWYTAGTMEFTVRGGEQVGVHGIGMLDRTVYHGAFLDGTAIHFASFDLWMVDAC
jgi:tetratricopeptide (TPR) repeat protein/transcriptional regulator with XRE-family HTH domain